MADRFLRLPSLFSGTQTAAGESVRYTLALSSFTHGTGPGLTLSTEVPPAAPTITPESWRAGAIVNLKSHSLRLDGYGLNFTGANLNNGVEVDHIR